MQIAYSTIALAIAFAAPAFSQIYALDDGSIDFQGEIIPAGNSIGFLQAFSVPGGGTDTIESISFITGVPSFSNSPLILNADGAPLAIAVWSDPNGDGNPSDAVLLGSTTGLQMYNCLTGLFATHTFNPPVQVSGAFFAGYAFDAPPASAGDYPVGATDTSLTAMNRSYRFRNGSASLDLVNLQANSAPPNSAFVFGVHMLRLNEEGLELPLGTSTCDSLTDNSANERAVLYANGNPDQTQGSFSLSLTAGLLPIGQTGYFLAAAATAPATTPFGSQGQLCLGGRIHRIKPSLTLVGDTGTILWRVDVNNVDSMGTGTPGFDVISAGQTWNFQGWYRDINPTLTSNLTNMVSIDFQ